MFTYWCVARLAGVDVNSVKLFNPLLGEEVTCDLSEYDPRKLMEFMINKHLVEPEIENCISLSKYKIQMRDILNSKQIRYKHNIMYLSDFVHCKLPNLEWTRQANYYTCEQSLNLFHIQVKIELLLGKKLNDAYVYMYIDGKDYRKYTKTSNKVILSLATSRTLTIKNGDKRVEFKLEPNSLFIMEDSEWSYSIIREPKIKTPQVSIEFAF